MARHKGKSRRPHRSGVFARAFAETIGRAKENIPKAIHHWTRRGIVIRCLTRKKIGLPWRRHAHTDITCRLPVNLASAAISRVARICGKAIVRQAIANIAALMVNLLISGGSALMLMRARSAHSLAEGRRVRLQASLAWRAPALVPRCGPRFPARYKGCPATASTCRKPPR